MDIGSKLKEIRTLKGLTQEELADRAELSKGFISQLERNLTSPSIVSFLMKHRKSRSYSERRIILKNTMRS